MAFLDQAEQWAREAGLPDKKIQHIVVAVEEALANIFQYAYPGGDGTVEIVCREDSQTLTLEIVDNGLPYNPLTREDPDTTMALDERPIGGLGVYLIKQLMDTVHYRREGDRNILTLVVEKK